MTNQEIEEIDERKRRTQTEVLVRMIENDMTVWAGDLSEDELAALEYLQSSCKIQPKSFRLVSGDIRLTFAVRQRRR